MTAIATMRGPAALFRMEAACMSVLQPLTGGRATGYARATSADGQTHVLPPNTYGVPVVRNEPGGAPYLDFSRIVKTVASFPSASDHTRVLGTTISDTGQTEVPVVSVLGGARQNLDPGTGVLWYPAIPAGIAIGATLAEGTTGATDAAFDPITGCPQIQRVVPWEGLGQQNVAQQIWRAGAGAFPAVVLAWESSDEGRPVGKGRYHYRHHFKAFVISTRLDGKDARRDEGRMILLAIGEELTDRAMVDGEGFSEPPIIPSGYGRLAIDPGSYVYTFGFSIQHTHIRTERRTWPPLEMTQEQLITYTSTGDVLDELTLVLQSQAIPPAG